VKIIPGDTQFPSKTSLKIQHYTKKVFSFII